jgi:hypothetical protein
MKKTSFNRGMAKLQRRGLSKRSAFNRMSALASVNKTNARMGNTQKSRRIARRNLSRVGKVKSVSTPNGRAKLYPRGHYKYIEDSSGYGEWTTSSGNPPSIYKGMEYDYGT